MSRGFQLLLPSALVSGALIFVTSGLSQPPAPDERPEAEATLRRYCVTCHNATIKAAGLILDPDGLAHIGTNTEIWEKVLQKLRGNTMPPPGAARPDGAVYTRVAGYLTRELELAAIAKPKPGEL